MAAYMSSSLRFVNFGWAVSVAGGLPGHGFQDLAQPVELRAEAFPISRLQSLDRLIVAIERLAGLRCRRAYRRSPFRRVRWRRRGAVICEQRGQGFCERLLHYDMFAVSRDHAFQLRQM